MTRTGKKKEHVALTKCYFCNGDHEILLATRYDRHGEPIKDLAELNGKVINTDPCNKCKELMSKGVMLIVIDEAKSATDWHKEPMPNPYRTGHMAVVKDAAIWKMIPDPGLAAYVCKCRFTFIGYDAAIKIGLIKKLESPTGEKEGTDA